jgi:CHAD domain-containing protein
MRKPPFNCAFQEDESLEVGFSRILAELSRRAKFLAINTTEPIDDRVHEGRLLIKRLRAMLWFARPAWGKKKAARLLKPLRQAAQMLADQRDRTVLKETLGHLVEKTAHDARNQAEMRRFKRNLVPDFDKTRSQELFQKAMAIVRGSAEMIRKRAGASLEWPKPKSRVRKAFRTVTEAALRAQKSKKDVDFHEWRKKAKRLAYVLELTGADGTFDDSKFVRRLEKLQERLGRFHDAVVVLEKVQKRAGRSSGMRVSQLLRKRKAHLKKKIFRVAAKIRSGPG